VLPVHYFEWAGDQERWHHPKEKSGSARWKDYLGQLQLDQIKRVHVNRFIESRLMEEVSPRTTNLDVIALRVFRAVAGDWSDSTTATE